MWTQLKKEYLRAATEFGDARKSLMGLLEETQDAVTNLASPYLDSIVSLVDLVATGGHRGASLSSEALELQNSLEFKEARTMVENIKTTLEKEDATIERHFLLSNMGNRKVILMQPDDEQIAEKDITDLQKTTRDYKSAHTRISDGFLKFSETFSELSASFPVGRAEFIRIGHDMRTRLTKSSGPQRRALALELFHGLQRYVK